MVTAARDEVQVAEAVAAFEAMFHANRAPFRGGRVRHPRVGQ